MILRVLMFVLAACTCSGAQAQEGPRVTERAPASEADEEVRPLHLAFADVSDPNPGSGFGQLIAGWVALGIGVAGAVQAPLCKYNDYDFPRGPRRCRNTGIAVGVIGLTLAVPWLTFGYQKRRAQRAWKQRHGLSSLPLMIGFDSDELNLSFRF